VYDGVMLLRRVPIGLLVLSALSCSKPASPGSGAAVSSGAPAPSTGAGDPAFCDTMTIKCPKPRPTAPDDIATCKELASDPRCGAVNVAAMRCDQSVDTCEEARSFKPCRAEHAAAMACMGVDPDGRDVPGGTAPPPR
jgi:hypothetical protein